MFEYFFLTLYAHFAILIVMIGVYHHVKRKAKSTDDIYHYLAVNDKEYIEDNKTPKLGTYIYLLRTVLGSNGKDWFGIFRFIYAFFMTAVLITGFGTIILFILGVLESIANP